MENKKVFNPGPLGLLGFGMTTVLLNLVNSGLLKFDVVIVAMGIFMGGIAQLIAGVLSFKQNKTFAGTAFTAYGLFWLSFVFIKSYGEKYGNADTTMLGFYLLLWGIFTTFMAIGTKKHSLTSTLVFSFLAALFYLLALGDFTEVTLITNIAGYVGIITGLLAFYEAVAQIVNEELDKDVLPL